MEKMSNFDKYLRPFWFSKNSDVINVPYVYGFSMMVLLILSIIIFLYMALSNRYEAGVLGTVAGVIATMAGLYFGIIKLYDNVKTKKIDCSGNGDSGNE